MKVNLETHASIFHTYAYLVNSAELGCPLLHSPSHRRPPAEEPVPWEDAVPAHLNAKRPGEYIRNHLLLDPSLRSG